MLYNIYNIHTQMYYTFDFKKLLFNNSQILYYVPTDDRDVIFYIQLGIDYYLFTVNSMVYEIKYCSKGNRKMYFTF